MILARSQNCGIGRSKRRQSRESKSSFLDKTRIILSEWRTVSLFLVSPDERTFRRRWSTYSKSTQTIFTSLGLTPETYPSGHDVEFCFSTLRRLPEQVRQALIVHLVGQILPEKS